MSNSRTDFISYLKLAKGKIVHKEVPNLEDYFSNLNSFNPLFNNFDSVFFLVDFRTNELKYLSPNSIDVQGYSVEEMKRLGPMRIIEKLYHPDDAELVINEMFTEGNNVFINTPNIDFAKSKISFTYRQLQKDGSYRMLLQQFTILMVDEDNNPLMIMGTISNIAELQTKNELFCSVFTMGANNKWKKLFERFYPIKSELEQVLSKKEMEIISFINKGLSSKEIANLTNRSEETIKTQRKKILQKTNCKNMTEVIALANRNAWV